MTAVSKLIDYFLYLAADKISGGKLSALERQAKDDERVIHGQRAIIEAWETGRIREGRKAPPK